MQENPDLLHQFQKWSQSRDEFHAHQASGWQKDYFRGLDMDGREAEGHQTKLRLCPFSAIKG